MTVSQKRKMILVAVEDSLFSHLADLGGQTASIYLQIIRQLLSIKGNIKGIPSGGFRLNGQIGQQLFSGGALRCDLDPFVEAQTLGGQILHKIEYERLVKSAIVLTGVENVGGFD